MARSDCRSTVAIGSHLIHPMPVVFPITLLVSVLATGLALLGTGDHFRVWASECVLAVHTRLTDMSGARRACSTEIRCTRV